jgi:lipoate---protein ligase
MQRLELTLPTPAENVALDEALLDWVEDQAPDTEILRIWESAEPMVVAGRSTRIAQEIDSAECRRRGIPVIRRSSGGAAILAGPGCLMYAVVLSYKMRPELRDISRAHELVLGRILSGLRTVLPPGSDIEKAGTSDLVLSAKPNSRARKFSGNSLRVKRTHCLYHGTLLYDLDLELISSCLRLPPRRPEYRASRSHQDFVENLPLDGQQLIQALDFAWPTTSALTEPPLSRVKELVDERFSQATWNEEFG